MEDPLEEDILGILDEAPKPDVSLGKNTHKDIAFRWQGTLLKGLSKNTKDILLKKDLIPANCQFLLAPTLNPEAKVAVWDVIVKSDSMLAQKQNQLGVALAAHSQLTESVLKHETSKQKLLHRLRSTVGAANAQHDVLTSASAAAESSVANLNFLRLFIN